MLGPVYTKRQCPRCDDASDSVLIENSGVAWKWVANPFWSDSCFQWEQNRKPHHSVDADAWYKWALTCEDILY